MTAVAPGVFSCELVRVLLADDTPDVRALVRLVLESSGGFEVVAEAADGAEAIRLIESHKPDLAVIDMAMPVMSGLEAIPEMRRLHPPVRIAVLTVLPLHDLCRPAMEAGADPCLGKGSPPAQLVTPLAPATG